MMELILTIITLILLFTLNMAAIFLLNNTLQEVLKQISQRNTENAEYNNKEPVKQKGGIPLQTNKKEE